MEFQDVVRKRKMVRSFEDRPIPRETVERIVANVQRAPSAGFSQGWGFLVLEGKEDTARYWDANWPKERRADWGWPDLFNAPLLIVCLSNKRQYLARYAEPDKGWTDMDEKRWPVPYWDIDTGMAALPACATDVVLQGVEARQATAFHELRGYEQPRRVADGRDRLSRRVDLLHDVARRRLHAQLVRVESASRQHDRVEFFRVRVFERDVRHKALVLLVVIHALDLGLRRDEHRVRAGLLERETGKRELHLLYSVRREDRDAHAFQRPVHHVCTSRRRRCRKEDARIR